MAPPDQERDDWFKAAFGRLYPMLYAHRDDGSASAEAAGLVSMLSLQPGRDRLLDVCCGAGRHAAALAEMGFEVAAADLSPFLLDRAMVRDRIRGRIARADMRALPFRPFFQAAINLFTSFGYFVEDRENERALREMAGVLAPGGRLALDHMNRTRVEQDLVEKDTVRINGCLVHQRRRIEKNRVIKEVEVVQEAGGTVHLSENVRLYEPAEMEAMFRAAGLGNVRFFGGFDGEPFRGDSARMIAVGTRD